MPPKILTLPPELVHTGLQNFRLTAQDIHALFRTPDWRLFNFRSEQIVFRFDFAGSNCSIRLSNQVLARALGITRQHVAKIPSKARQVQKPPHPPVKLNEDEERAVLQVHPKRIYVEKLREEKRSLKFSRRMIPKDLELRLADLFFASPARRYHPNRCETIGPSQVTDSGRIFK
jgi:hypothetical protein